MDSWLNPYNTTEWWADLECEGCEKDTEHWFMRQCGAVSATCMDCGRVNEIDPDEL